MNLRPPPFTCFADLTFFAHLCSTLTAHRIPGDLVEQVLTSPLSRGLHDALTFALVAMAAIVTFTPVTGVANRPKQPLFLHGALAKLQSTGVSGGADRASSCAAL